jgi:hypothetical protein
MSADDTASKYMLSPNVVDWLTTASYFEGPGSNLGLETAYSDQVLWFSSVPPVNAGIMP